MECNPQSVLIVDGDRSVHELLRPELSGRGWTVEDSYSSADALARLQVTPYDLVLADLGTTGNDRCEWLRRVRVLRPYTKVMVMTAGSTPTHVLCAIREHAFSYFSKPVSPPAVAEMMAHAIEMPAWDDDIRVISAIPAWTTLEVRCKMEAAERVVQFMRELKADLTPNQREDIAVAVRELMLNAIEHGGGSDPQKRIRISYVRTARALVYHIQDPGEGFSFDTIPHAAVANPQDDPIRHAELREEQGVRPGGFGILLTRNLVDELVYNERGNEVLFLKYLGK